jgi:DNA-directed RNA polymerase specialized sigma24 family protein
MVKKAENWKWSSYPSHLGSAPCPPWLDSDWLLSQFGKRRSSARSKFQQFVTDGMGRASPLEETRHQLLLGDDSFVKQFRDDPQSSKLREHSQAHRRALALSLNDYSQQLPNRDSAMHAAYKSTAYTMQEIADHFGVHITTASKAIRKMESAKTGKDH